MKHIRRNIRKSDSKLPDMNLQKAHSYYNKPCRFKLKSGKEVFGVIWKGNNGSKGEHYFASSGEYMLFKKAERENDVKTCEKIKSIVDVEEFVSAEYI